MRKIGEFIINNSEYILGAITAIIILTLTYLFNFLRNKIKRREFKKLLIKDYINPIKTEITNKNIEHEFVDYQNKLAKQLTRLTYLKKEEINYINNNNQFYYIRSIEYTKILLSSLHTETGKYEYRSSKPTEKEQEQEEEYTKNKKRRMLELMKIYEEDFDKYTKLEIDHLRNS